MQIVVDLSCAEPVFAQLVQQIKTAVQEGHMNGGDPLPSIRQLATDLEINNKTVAKAYRLLERDGVIQARGYRGTFVHPDAHANCSNDLQAWANTQITELVARLRLAGVTDSETRIAFAQVLSERSNKGD